MAKQTFTTGQVLTAAQMNSLQANDYNWTTSAKTASYVLAAADAGTTITMSNAGATTITVNTGIFSAGDRIAIINLGAGTTTITAGTATVNSAGSLSLPQYGAGTLWFSSASAAIFIPDDRTVSPGLTLISTTTIGSAVSSVTVSSVFNSTYDNYKIIISGGAANTDVVIGTTLGSTSTGYYCAYTGANYSAAGSSNFADNNASSWSRCVSSTTSGAMGVFDLIGPNLAKRTFIIGSQMDPTISRFAAGYLNDTTQYTSITFTVSGGTQTGGTIRVYGYQNS